MKKTLRRFPSYFPDGCPPDAATDVEKELYRLCESSPPTPEDFISFYLRDPYKYKNICQAYGLSVFDSEDACKKACDKVPRLRKKYKYRSRGFNTPDRGKILATPSKAHSQHITWWVYEGVEPHTFFETCLEGGGDNG
jgi:hypothetical protein